ncbi:hypothetical protein AKG39_13950 [Acetobacterium bakii]|uniref:Uncharacterized protein n=1 Tax=Acetobacterium bakii TaxID=52689 RepID=A0A0L6TYJ7_9FIRM|nr:hypothetical protein AKG39_13950 [Acetobacterium bakii]
MLSLPSLIEFYDLLTRFPAFSIILITFQILNKAYHLKLKIAISFRIIIVFLTRFLKKATAQVNFPCAVAGLLFYFLPG